MLLHFIGSEIAVSSDDTAVFVLQLVVLALQVRVYVVVFLSALLVLEGLVVDVEELGL